MVVTLFLLVTRLLLVPWPAACVLRPSLMRRRRVGADRRLGATISCLMGFYCWRCFLVFCLLLRVLGFSPCACMLACGRCVFCLVFCLRTRCICFVFLVGSNFRLPVSWLDRPARRARSRGFGGSAYNGRVVDGRVIFSCSA